MNKEGAAASRPFFVAEDISNGRPPGELVQAAHCSRSRSARTDGARLTEPGLGGAADGVLKAHLQDLLGHERNGAAGSALL